MLILAMAHEQTIKPIVEAYERAALERHQFRIAPKWVDRGMADQVILDPVEAHLLGDEDAAVYYRDCYAARDAAGLVVDHPEKCPYCVAHNLRLKAEESMLEALSEAPGLGHLKEMFYADGELSDKAIDLGLRLLTPFVAKNMVQTFIKCDETNVALLSGMGVLAGEYDHDRHGLDAVVPMEALVKIAGDSSRFQLVDRAQNEGATRSLIAEVVQSADPSHSDPSMEM